VKFVRRGTNYLPHLIGSTNWTSRIAVRNNGGGPAFAKLLFFDAYGNVQCTTFTDTPISTNDFMTFNIGSTFCPQAASASVDTSQDTAMIVQEDQNASGTDGYNGIAAVDLINASWGQAGTTLFAPVIMNNYYGWTSELVLFNASSSTASGSITYYGGAYPGGITYPFSGLAPNQTLRTNFAGATNTLYSARIGSSRPLAGIVRQYSGSVNEAYNALSTGSTANYAPLIMNNYYGWDTSVTVQNTTGPGWLSALGLDSRL
jgi:hypothetical protein